MSDLEPNKRTEEGSAEEPNLTTTEPTLPSSIPVSLGDNPYEEHSESQRPRTMSNPFDPLQVKRNTEANKNSAKDLFISTSSLEPEEHDPTPSKRVQWNPEVSSRTDVLLPENVKHTSIQIGPLSPQTLKDEGAHAVLEAALREHSMDPEKTWARKYFGDTGSGADTPVNYSEPPSRDSLSESVYDNMEVYVDSNERDGLPNSTSNPTEEADKRRTAKEAWSLVRNYQQGQSSLLRNRKHLGFSRGLGLQRDSSARILEEDETELKEEEPPKLTRTQTIFRSMRRKNDGDQPPRTGALERAEEYAPVGPTSGRQTGILSALIALQQAQASVTGTATPSPKSSYPSSRVSLDLDYDEELEKQNFLEKLREKKGRNWLEQSVEGAKSLGRSSMDQLRGNGKTGSGTGKNVNNGSHGGIGSWITSRTTSSGHSRQSSESPTSHEMGNLKERGSKPSKFETVSSSVKNMGSKVGLDLGTSSSRPGAAKSSAGVLGGLVMSTANLAGVATPAGGSLAPQADRAGYHISRYETVPSKKPGGSPSERSNPCSPSSSRPPSHLGSRAPSPERSNTAVSDGTPPTYIKSSGESTPPKKRKFNLSLPKEPHSPSVFKFSINNSPVHTPGGTLIKDIGDYFSSKETVEEREQREWEKEKRRRRKAKEKKKQQEVYITMHVAAILARQEFILKMGRSFMMFGAPSHRLEAQIQATARVLEINAQVLYIPGIMLISFGDSVTHTSEVKFLKQNGGLDLGKLLAAYTVYYQVIHDQISVTEASVELDRLMTAPPHYRLMQHLLIGGLASAFIQPSAFHGSFIDCLVAIPLGALLVLVQVLVSRNDLYSSLFEIVIACINSFLAAALASTNQFCFSAVASGSVVLILPGYIVLCGSLELVNRSIISGSVRLVYSVLYSLFLGFGMAMGGEVWQRIAGKAILNGSDFTCSALRVDAPWWRASISPYYFFLTIPSFLLLLSLRNGQPLLRKEVPIMLTIGAAGFCSNYFSSKAFVGRPDISSAIGSFVVGLAGNIYGKLTGGSPFVVMVVGVLMQLPSGLANGGLLRFATNSADKVSSDSTYSVGFSAAQSLVEVAIGLTVGLFLSAAVVNLVAGGGRRRGNNLSSF